MEGRNEPSELLIVCFKRNKKEPQSLVKVLPWLKALVKSKFCHSSNHR